MCCFVQDMSNLLWAYGQVREEMDEKLLESLAQRLIANRKELRPVSIPINLMVRFCSHCFGFLGFRMVSKP